jgi:hypothetical protein
MSIVLAFVNDTPLSGANTRTLPFCSIDITLSRVISKSSSLVVSPFSYVALSSISFAFSSLSFTFTINNRSVDEKTCCVIGLEISDIMPSINNGDINSFLDN